MDVMMAPYEMARTSIPRALVIVKMSTAVPSLVRPNAARAILVVADDAGPHAKSASEQASATKGFTGPYSITPPAI